MVTAVCDIAMTNKHVDVYQVLLVTKKPICTKLTQLTNSFSLTHLYGGRISRLKNEQSSQLAREIPSGFSRRDYKGGIVDGNPFGINFRKAAYAG
jgi:hypothetical protein